MAAKKAALDDWFAKAKDAGYAKAIWPMAADKQLSCEKKGNSFECVAAGRACTVEQKAPDDFVPEPRVKPQPSSPEPTVDGDDTKPEPE